MSDYRFEKIKAEAERQKTSIHNCLLKLLYEDPRNSRDICSGKEAIKALNSASTILLDGGSDIEKVKDAARYINMYMYYCPDFAAKMQIADKIIKWLCADELRFPLRYELAKEFSYAEVSIENPTKRSKYARQCASREEFIKIPLVEEYCWAWKIRSEVEPQIQNVKGRTEKTFGGKVPNVCSIHSIKGGTGKTTFAIGLAVLASQRSGQRSCMLDFDFSGSSLDYLIRDPKLRSDLISGEYRTFYNWVEHNHHLNQDSLYDTEIATSDREVWPKGIVQTGAISLGQYLGYIAIRPDGVPFFREKLFGALRELSGGKVTQFVFDNAPGLYSHSAVVFALARALHGHLLFVTTPRHDCLVPTLYELPWDFDITGGRILVCINMVSEGFSLKTALAGLVRAERTGKFGDGVTVPALFAEFLRILRYVVPEDADGGGGNLYIYNGKKIPYVSVPFSSAYWLRPYTRVSKIWETFKCRLDREEFWGLLKHS